MSIDILEKSFFDPDGKATSSVRREERRSKINLMTAEEITESYMNFGYDYFDNPECLNGYGGYISDDRYSDHLGDLVNYFGLKRDSKILDYGCAKGSIVLSFLTAGFKNVVGVDVSEYALSHAPQILQTRLFQLDDNISILDDLLPVDLFVSKDVLPHLTVQQMDRLFKKLKQCGTLKLYFEIQCVDERSDLTKLAAWDATHQTCLTSREWTDFLEDYFDDELSVHYKRII